MQLRDGKRENIRRRHDLEALCLGDDTIHDAALHVLDNTNVKGFVGREPPWTHLDVFVAVDGIDLLLEGRLMTWR